MRRFEWPRRALLGACALFLPLLAQAQTSGWDAWLASQIQQHPDVLAAREQWLGSNASADAVEQPIYNPELSTDLERIGEEDNYRVGVSQTIDSWDRRGAKRQQAGYLRSAAEALYRQQVLDKTFDALAALVEWHAANRAAAITQAQQQQLNTLLELVKKRQQAGDLGSIDAELTFLSGMGWVSVLRDLPYVVLGPSSGARSLAAFMSCSEALPCTLGTRLIGDKAGM